MLIAIYWKNPQYGGNPMCTRAIQPAGIIGIALLLGLNGCLSAKDNTISDSIRPARAKLTRADDCDDLLTKIQQDVIAKVDLYAQALRFPDKYSSSSSGEFIPIDSDTAHGVGVWTNSGSNTGAGGALGKALSGAGGSTATFTTRPSNGASSNSSNENAATPVIDGYDSDESTGATGTRSASTPSSFSTTTKQVDAVDEPDIVKTDGKFLYVLHGDSLFILKAWEPTSLKEESKIKIEGSATEMFVHQGKAVVFSTVYDNNGTIRGIAADAGASAQGSAGYGYGDYYYPEYAGATFTKITVIDVAPSTKPKTVRELFIEGSYLSARLYANTDKEKAQYGAVRAIVTGGFKAPNIYNANIDYYNSWGKRYEQAGIDEQVSAWRDRIVADIRATKLQDWLPIEKEKVDNTFTDVQWLCDEFYAPSPGFAEYGMTHIVAFDLSDKPGTALAGASVLGDAAEVYSNESVLVLAHADWSWQMRAALVPSEDISGEQIALHRFNLQGLATKYDASGFVAGHIVDQFSIDESGGIIRVSTTKEGWNNRAMNAVAPTRATAGPEATTSAPAAQGPENRVFTLEAKEDKLVQVGSSTALGKPGERIKSTRFLGDTAYVVTFRQIDPLIVLDIKDPAKIRVVGEVTIPGFSEYIHPIDQGHLLTIGRDTNEFNRDSGLLLQIFDVTDPANPTQAYKYSYTRQGWSEANQNHKAFTYFAEKKLLAFPFASNNFPMVSTLELFRVNTASGFEPLGSIDHTDLFKANATCKEYIDTWGRFDPYACAWPSAEVRRGVFISGAIDGADAESDYIYSISYAGVKVHDINHLDRPVAAVSLPAIESTDGSYYGGAGRVSFGQGGSTAPWTGTGGSTAPWTGGPGGSGGLGGVAGSGGFTGEMGGTAGENVVDAGSSLDPDSGAADAGSSADGAVPSA
jgi:hypothetical protein